MKVIVNTTKSFRRQAKPLLKKYPSLKIELFQLELELKDNPRLGQSLGNDSYKIRLAVKSKGKGKRSGMRIISHVQTELIGFVEINGGSIIVNLIAIYDKSETENISDKELKDLIISIQND